MRTTFRVKQPYADIFLKCAEDFVCNSPVRPERFIQIMKKNQGAVSAVSGMGLDEDGLERKNPVIVALGDSVTAGRFESLLPADSETIHRFMERMMNTPKEQEEVEPFEIEIADARESYAEKFRAGLIDLFEKTSVSIINAGLAGDNLISMEKRAYRDVIRYQPDLVLINGSLNWSEELGSTEDYKKILVRLIQRIKTETIADIVLLTPNGDLPNESEFLKAMGIPAVIPTTAERVEVIRQTATEEQVCLADVYAVWEAAREQGCPWEELLANGANHPGVEGHEVYARVLMKLFE